MKPSHSTFSADSSIRRRLPLLAALALVYFLAGKFGLSMAYVHRSATAVWPPTGIALFALLVFGYRVWPAIFAGAFAVNLMTDGAIHIARNRSREYP